MPKTRKHTTYTLFQKLTRAVKTYVSAAFPVTPAPAAAAEPLPGTNGHGLKTATANESIPRRSPNVRAIAGTFGEPLCEKKQHNAFMGFIITILIALFNIMLLLFPRDVLLAAREGLGLWFNNVLPSLAPFVIGTNLLVGLGAVNFIGALLEPVMAPVFGVPGCGGFALITGMTSGYPMGAKTAAELRAKNALTQTEAQRLAAFVNNSGPLFILGAVGAGMFHSQQAGYFLMAAHYGGAILTGLLFKYFRRHEVPSPHKGTERVFAKAVIEMKKARRKDGRPFGLLLADSVQNAMESMLYVGGFILLFCVLVRILTVTNAFAALQRLLAPLFMAAHMDSMVSAGFLTGVLEVTNGAKLLAAENHNPTALLACAALLSFGGLSIHAQSIGLMSKTDIRPSLYLLSKCVHAVFSLALAMLLHPFFTFSYEEAKASAPVFLYQQNGLWERFAYSTLWFLLAIVLMGVAALFFYALNALIRRRKR